MDRGKIALKLFLDELGIRFSIGTLDDRKRVQKAVYLGQLSGVDLGYRFGWYIMGPYCPALTRDYFTLAEALGSDDTDWKGKTLKAAAKERLAVISPLLPVPENIGLDEEDWLELVASVHFLRTVSKLNDEDLNKTLKREKPHLHPFLSSAKDILTANGRWS